VCVFADFNCTEAMTHYKLTYFPLRARGEIVRFVFAAAGVEYEDHRIEMSQWSELKPSKSPMNVGRSYLLPLDLFYFALQTLIPHTADQLGPKCGTKNWLRDFTHPCPNVYHESKSPKCSFDFRPQSHLKRSDFETEQHIGNLKNTEIERL